MYQTHGGLVLSTKKKKKKHRVQIVFRRTLRYIARDINETIINKKKQKCLVYNIYLFLFFLVCFPFSNYAYGKVNYYGYSILCKNVENNIYECVFGPGIVQYCIIVVGDTGFYCCSVILFTGHRFIIRDNIITASVPFRMVIIRNCF